MIYLLSQEISQWVNPCGTPCIFKIIIVFFLNCNNNVNLISRKLINHNISHYNTTYINYSSK